jgi:hypothetical protein
MKRQDLDKYHNQTVAELQKLGRLSYVKELQQTP